MEKENYSQLELFSAANAANQRSQIPGSLLRYLKGFEKTIIFIIAFILTGIISFSWGVKKGKEITLHKASSYIDIAVKPKPAVSKKEPVVTIRQELNEEAKFIQPGVENFTIQVASYQARSLAQEEASRLNSKGMASSVLSKGKYLVVCVGNFSDRNSAQVLLAQLKKRYRDCFIRRL